MKSYQLGKGFTFKPHTIHIPARPFLSLTEDDRIRISDIITQYYLPE